MLSLHRSLIEHVAATHGLNPPPGGDEAVSVPANVEHDEISDIIRRGEGGTQSLKAREVVPLHDFEPSGKGMFAIGVLCPKLA